MCGVGFFTGADVNLRFVPAAADYGVRFRRVDCPGSEPIPARIEHVVDSHRRTVIEHQSVRVEMVEHVMAALAGLGIDNCTVELDAPEPPGCDGSCREFCDRILDAGIEELDQPTSSFVISNTFRVLSDDGHAELAARPLVRPVEAVTYTLDYGARSVIPSQVYSIELTREAFVEEIAFARTFIPESEIRGLKARGYGQRVTAEDLLIVGTDGIVDNSLRAPDEFVRHKILDCIGDFALFGCEFHGHVSAWRSGHLLNHRFIRRLSELRSLPTTGNRAA